MVPTLEFPPLIPSTDQVTEVSLLPVTVAVKVNVELMAIMGAVGEMVMPTPDPEAGLTVTIALADFVGSALAIAVTVTVIEAVTAGAV